MKTYKQYLVKSLNYWNNNSRSNALFLFLPILGWIEND